MAGDLSIAVVPTSAQRLAANLGGVRTYLHSFTRDILYQEAGLAARAFMKFTPPIPSGGGMGDTKQARAQGEKAVAKDVASFMMDKSKSTLNTLAELSDDYQTFVAWRSRKDAPKLSNKVLQKIHADTDIDRAYRKMINLRGSSGEKYRRMAPLLKSKPEIKRVHDELRRDYKGRIVRNGGPGMSVQMRPFVAEQKLINQYVKDRQKAVGKLSSGWWSLLQKIPTIRIRGIEARAGEKGVPEWIKRHKAPSMFIDKVGPVATVNSSVTIINAIGDIFGVAKDADTKAKVIRYRKAAMAKRPYQRVLDQAILTATRGGKPQ